MNTAEPTARTTPASSMAAPASSPAPMRLPSGGGALRGMGETFSTNPVTGTASAAIPILVSPARDGFGPQLTLSYDSGAGNGPFGLGWRLSTSAIIRKTDAGLPMYRDGVGTDPDSDAFVIDGADELVALVDDAGVIVERTRGAHRVRRYRPRVDSTFARLERWTNGGDPRDVSWRLISPDNVTTVFGADPLSRICDPDDQSRIFSWLISHAYDCKGNAVVYRYVGENADHVDLTHPAEVSRVRSAGRYLDRIVFGNRTPNRDDAGAVTDPSVLPAETWMFEVVFDYGLGRVARSPDGTARATMAAPAGATWPPRLDAFSSYRAGFEVRTHRLCTSVLMFHHFPAELGRPDCLVSSTTFDYAASPVLTTLVRATHTGFAPSAAPGDGTPYVARDMPPVELTYTAVPSPAELASRPVQVVMGETTLDPLGAGAARVQWVDLDGEGAAGALVDVGGSWSYARNLSPLAVPERSSAQLSPPQPVATQPSTVMGRPATRLVDLEGDGSLDVVVLDEPLRGFFERTGGDWAAFRTFASWPQLDLTNEGVRFVDLTGDGRADIIIGDQGALTWHRSLGEDGFGDARGVAHPVELTFGRREAPDPDPDVIRFADLSGDGLADMVAIRNGGVSYWPNLGYGRFGTRVAMAHAPMFDLPDQFDPRRVHLADIDGSGTTDIIYAGRDGPEIYFNQSGNSWSDAVPLPQVAAVEAASGLQVLDLLGNGTAAMTWTSATAGGAGPSTCFVDLMGGKPHLLASVVNNLGLETVIHYASSTRFFLEDERAGRPWATRLPFPVQVVEQVDTIDHISQNRFSIRYAYHHGHFDAAEREFGGFGLVDTWDSVSLDITHATNHSRASDVPVCLTRTWYHTGARTADGSLSRAYRRDFYREGDASDHQPGLGDSAFDRQLLDDAVLPTTWLRPSGSIDVTLDEKEVCESHRALRGALLRQEIYALDGSDAEDRPYSVSERCHAVALLQPRGSMRHASFTVRPREQLDLDYERALIDVAGVPRADPRVSHAVTLDVDLLGNVVRSMAVAYRRRDLPGIEVPEQLDTHVSLTVTRVRNVTDEDDWYRVGVPVETMAYEVVAPPDPTIDDTRIVPFSFAQLRTLAEGLFPLAATEPPAASIWPFEQWDWRIDPAHRPAGARLRPTEHSRRLYRRDDLTAGLALGDVQSMALPFDTLTLAITAATIDSVYRREPAGQPATALIPDVTGLSARGADGCGYVSVDGGWWSSAGRLLFHPDADPDVPSATAAVELAEARTHFFTPRVFVGAFGERTTVTHDAHTLLSTISTDAVGNVAAVENDYRILQPRKLVDANGNRSTVAFDALGVVVAVAAQGKEGEHLGDTLDGIDPDPLLPVIQQFALDPTVHGRALLLQATTRTVYDIDRFRRCGQTPTVTTLARLTHASEPDGAASAIQVSMTFADAFGREIQKKILAEPGDAPQRGPSQPTPTGDAVPGALTHAADGSLVVGPATPRWVASGRTVYNNKAKPIRQFAPFFSSTPLFEAEPEVTDGGHGSVYFYDPLARLVATLNADNTYTKVTFGPWQQAEHDSNDTVLDDPRTDPDVSGLMAGFMAGVDADWKTWHAARKDGSLGMHEQAAANQTERHAHTPGIRHVDALGRAVFAETTNRVERKGAVVDDRLVTRIVFDGGGRQRTAIDALGHVVVRNDHDVAGRCIHSVGAEAGHRWTLFDTADRQLVAWSARGHITRTSFDALRRPVQQTVVGADPNDPARAVVVQRTVYGDSFSSGLTRAQARQLNLLTHVHRHMDGASEVTNVGTDPATGAVEAFDFKGNRLRSTRRLVSDHRAPADWGAAQPPALDEPMTTASAFNALNAPTALTAPDASVTRCHYNAANLLDRLIVTTTPGADATVITGIDYDAHGRSRVVGHGNGATTSFDFDPVTKRLVGRRTSRPGTPDAVVSQLFVSASLVQDMSYVYDPVGHITRVEDSALKTVFNDNQVVAPVAEHVYDALYQLVSSAGREHIAQCALAAGPPRDAPFAGPLGHANDLRALRNYTESFEYDRLGNITTVRHVAAAGSWTRTHTYVEPSLIDATETSNRLSSTTIGADTVTYGYGQLDGNDGGGCVTTQGTRALRWDHADRLVRVDLGGGDTVFHVYDSTGQRMRTVIEHDGSVVMERVYGRGFERHRELVGGVVRNERTSLHVMNGDSRAAIMERRTIVDAVPFANAAWVTRYQYGDHIRSSRIELDSAGGLIGLEEHHPFGTSSFQAGATAAEVSLKRYRYTAQERDEATGFLYHGARYYVPWIGRWLSTDPVGLGDGPNVYVYAYNRPVSVSDPTGAIGWQKVETEDSSADLYYNQDKGLAVRKSAAATELWKETDTNQYQGVLTIMTPERYTHAGPKTIKRDINNMQPNDFQDKYGVTYSQYDQLSKALIEPPPPIVIPEDKTVYWGADGHPGTAEQLATRELNDRLQGIHPPTLTGSIFGAAAFVLGGDSQEAVRMMQIGDQIDGLLTTGMTVAGGIGMLRRGSGGAPPTPSPPRDPSEGKFKLPILPNQGFVPNKTPDQAIQGATTRVAQRLNDDRTLIPNYLTPGENRLSTYGPWAQRVVFGNAVERALATGSAPTGLLIHTGDVRPAPRGGNDFIGTPGTPYEGAKVQITTYKGYWTHFEKAPPDTIWGLYDTFVP